MTPKKHSKNNKFHISGNEYDDMLHKGIRLSGESKRFFMTGRIEDLCEQLPHNYAPTRILDFGCGIGDSTQFLAETFPMAEVIGIDMAEDLVAFARQTHGSERVSFTLMRDYQSIELFDLCYVNGVFHHIHPTERVAALTTIKNVLVPGGYFAFFENNPWNPGTRLVMKRIPFDHNAQPLSSRAARRLLVETGFKCLGRTRFLFCFPRSLAFLRFCERWLVHFPLGAQYWLLATRSF
jgi:SAM-dependent methyltransferase